MMMKALGGETWRFEVSRRCADRVFLVQEAEGGVSSWIEMSTNANGQWELIQTLPPGRHRFRYFANEDGAYYNCGTEGLQAQRISGGEDDTAPHPQRPGSVAMSA